MSTVEATVQKLQSVTSTGQGWPTADENIVGETMISAPELPTECFGNAKNYLERAANGANVKPDYVAAMLLSAVCGLKGKSYSVRISSDWFEPLILWTALVGPPSSGKTPACQPIRRHLRKLETDLIEQHRSATEQKLIELKTTEASTHEIERVKETLDRPPRYLVNDSTSEALARIEAQSPHGLLVERDELAGLIEGLERYSAGVDRAFYLEAWTPGPFTQDRVKAGTIAIPDHCFAISGGIQPDRLRSLLTHGGDDDGLAARLLYFWPDLLPPRRIPQGADHSIMQRAFARLVTLEAPNDCHLLHLSESAYEHFDDWYLQEHGKRIGTTGKIGSALGKLPGITARLAGLLHMIDWSFDNHAGQLLHTIDKAYIAAALTLVESYFVPQIMRAYHGANQPPAEALAAAILIRAKDKRESSINLRTVRREWKLPGSSKSGAPKLFDDAAQFLIESGWLRERRGQGGSKDYDINPQLFETTVNGLERNSSEAFSER